VSNQQNSPQNNFITINNLKLHYLEWGNQNQEKVILLHGYNNCAATWIPLARKLACCRHVLALDLRGHGDSQWANSELYTNEYFVSDLTAFIEALNIKQLSIIGHSMGGIIALSYAAAYPEKVVRLIIEDIGPRMSKRVGSRAAKMLLVKKEVYPSLEEAVKYLEAADPLAQRELLLWEVAHLTRPLPGNGFTWKQHQMFGDSSQPKVAKPLPDRTEKRWHMVTQVTCPTLILKGAESDILDDEVAQAMVAGMPRAELVTIERAGHYVHRDNPKHFEKTVLRFLGLDECG